ncbi:MAG: T9SS type A sorting domain-containing protein [Bacteroidetes bacterium]|nr:T9SS type A sorting domain-containing protein [Bacteroidota bacterium]
MMKTGFRFISALILLSAISSSVIAQIDPVATGCKEADDIARMERLGHERITERGGATQASANFDVKYYRCEWEVNPAIRYITGKVTVYYLMTAASSSVSLDLMNGLIVDSVKQRSNALSILHTSNLLQVNFPASVNAGVMDSISIYYRGIPPNTGFGSFVLSTHAGIPVMWTLSEPYGSRDWWPCKNGLDDKADSIDIFITNPVAYKAASNGLLQSETLTAGGTKRTAWWKHRYPITSYLVCFAVTNYTVFNNSVQLGAVTLPMQTYCYPESVNSFQTNTPMVLNALQLFHNLFGEYPFIKEKYGHVQFSWGGGMEHQTASFIVNAGEGLMAHELAHQWFGDKITCGSWEDIWLNEGFATHLTSIYMEAKYPSTILNNRRNEINSITSQPGGSVWVNDTNSVGRIFDGRLSYTKGSHLLYMLRWIMGDSAFFKAMRDYLTDPLLSFGYAKTSDLKRHLEKHAGKDLSYFFNPWFKGQGYPSYRVEWTPLGSSYVKIKMSQTTSHNSVPFFELPVALRFQNTAQQKTIVVDNKFNGEIFIRSLGFTPDTVFIDPEYWLISKNNTSQKNSITDGPQNVVQVFPNPVGNQFYVWLRNFTSPMASVSLYNGLGQMVFSKNLALQSGSEFFEVPSGHLASGIYYLHVRTNNGIHVTRKVLR